MLVKKLLSCWLSSQKRIKPIYWLKINNYHTEIDLGMPATSLGHIKKILRQQNILFQDGHSCLIFNCPVCDLKKEKELKVFVNKTTGMFFLNQFISFFLYKKFSIQKILKI